MMRWLLGFLAITTAQQAPMAHPAVALQSAEAMSCALTDDACLQQEFALRHAADQGVRAASAEDLGCSSSDQACLIQAWRRIDSANQERLIAIVSARGWPPFQDDAAVGAWLIAQHVPTKPEAGLMPFREKVLFLVREEVRAGRLHPDHYARMADRNALARGLKQPYGSNRPCRDGVFDRSSIDAVELVDQRRRDIGMDIMLSESLPLFDQLCGQEGRKTTG